MTELQKQLDQALKDLRALQRNINAAQDSLRAYERKLVDASKALSKEIDHWVAADFAAGRN